MVRKALIAAILFISGAAPAFAEVNWANTLAVIIGNADYGREDVPDLPFASNDVRAMEEFVRDGLGVPDSNIKVLRNAGLNEFRGVFGKGRWLDTEVQRTRANVLVYISSHGVPDKNQNAYFVPSNADPSFPEDLYPRTEVVAALERARSFQEGRDRRVVAIFDSCFSGGSSNGALTPGKTGLPSMDIQQDDEDVTIFSAVSNSGIAYPDEDAQLSALTSAFLQGWAGEADNPVDGGNGDTQVSLLELSDFVQRSVPVLSKRNQQPDIKPGQSFSITPFALASLRPQLAAKEAQRRWEELDLGALNASVLGLGVEDLRPRRGYLRQLNGEVRRLQGWCRKQPKNACSRFAASLTKVPLQIRQQRQRLEDQLAWKNAEDRQTFKIDCDAYKRACAQLEARMPGYSCLHEADLQWECPSDDVPLLETARSNGTAESWQAYLDGCATCADEEEANLAIATLKDQTAWKAALDTSTIAGFEQYLATCRAPCRHKQEANARIEALEEKVRIARLRNEDEAAWKKAVAADTIIGFRRYIETCKGQCKHKQEALKKIDILKEKVRIAKLKREDDAAWDRVSFSKFPNRIQQQYLDQCNEVCAHKSEAEIKIEQINKRENARKQQDLREADEQRWKRTVQSTDIRSYQTYLNNCNEICAYRDLAKNRISELHELNLWRQQKAMDFKAWQKAMEVGTKDAFMRYIEQCAEPCQYKSKALEKIDYLAQTAKQHINDFEKWRKASAINTADSYQNYVDSCDSFCSYRLDAEKKIEYLRHSRSELIEADRKAWLSVKYVASATIVRNRYLDQCNEVCAYKTDAKKLINKLNSDEISRIGRLSKSNQVKLLQRFLNNLGCNAGSVDGVMGRGTERAFDRFVATNDFKTRNVTDNNLRYVLAVVKVWNPGKYKRCDGKKTVSSSRSDTNQTFRDCASCPLMVKIPTGTFTMGSNKEAQNAKPAHTVYVKNAFALGVYEVTYREWKACVDDGYCTSQTAPMSNHAHNLRRPVTNVSWNDIQSPHRRGFVAWLNSKVSGSPYRLPSEAEWEYAARGKSPLRYWWGYNDPVCQKSSVLFSSAVFNDCEPKGAREVGFSQPNLFGLYDVIGNVGELVQDCYENTHRTVAHVQSPRSRAGCKQYVVRGGGWQSEKRHLTTSSRKSWLVTARSAAIGFRIARDL